MKDYYKILNIKKSSDDKTIKKAYKKLALKYHPDHNPGDKRSEEKFKEIKEAYEVLIDPKKRSMYDYSGYDSDNYYSNTEYSDDFFGDVFSDMFGKNQKTNYKAENIKHIVELSLKESVLGINKNINLFILDICSQCSGSGTKDNIKHTCYQCRGSGYIKIQQGFFTIQQTCHVCHGEGDLIKNYCSLCKGEGRLRVNKTISVNFPAGINESYQIQLTGEGNIARRGGLKGDIFIYVKIKEHAFFQRTNNDLYCEIPITFFTAALGGEIEIPTFENNIKLKIPKETQSNKIFKIKGKGVQDLNNSSIKGDILCKIIVEIPINLNENQKFLLRQLQDSFGKGINTLNHFPYIKTFLDTLKKI